MKDQNRKNGLKMEFHGSGRFPEGRRFCIEATSCERPHRGKKKQNTKTLNIMLSQASFSGRPPPHASSSTHKALADQTPDHPRPRSSLRSSFIHATPHGVSRETLPYRPSRSNLRYIHPSRIPRFPPSLARAVNQLKQS
jgi:hypothetical protein